VPLGNRGSAADRWCSGDRVADFASSRVEARSGTVDDSSLGRPDVASLKCNSLTDALGNRRDSETHVHNGQMTQTASTAQIRQWARDAGLPVAERGRLSPETLAAFEAAHSEVVGTPSTPPLPAVPTPRRSDLPGKRIIARPRKSGGPTGRKVRARSK
jgi:hypothetical protein